MKVNDKSKPLLRRHLRDGDCFEYESKYAGQTKMIMLDEAPWKQGLRLPPDWSWSHRGSSSRDDYEVRRVPRWDAARPPLEPKAPQPDVDKLTKFWEQRKIARMKREEASGT